MPSKALIMCRNENDGHIFESKYENMLWGSYNFVTMVRNDEERIVDYYFYIKPNHCIEYKYENDAIEISIDGNFYETIDYKKFKCYCCNDETQNINNIICSNCGYLFDPINAR